LEPSYQNILPVSGTIWQVESEYVPCLSRCDLDNVCVAIFYSNEQCIGYGQALHLGSFTVNAPGMKYAEISGCTNVSHIYFYIT